MRLLIVLVLAMLLAGAATGADYYACECQAGAQSGCQPGDDAQSGQSPSAPWRTFDRLASASPGSRCGDTFNLCEGGVFSAREATRDFATSEDCSANPRVLRSYDPGAFTQRPRVESSSAYPGIIIGSYNAGPSVAGLTIRDLELRQTVPVGGSRGLHVSRGARNLVIDSVIVDGFDICLEVSETGGISQLITRNSTFRKCGTQGVLGRVASGSQFIDNTIEDSACRLDPSTCGFQHSFYWSTDTATTDLVFRGNTVRRSNRVGGACSGNPVTIRGGNGLVFEDNVIDMRDAGGTRDPSAPCYSVRFNQNGGSANVEGCLNCTIRSNQIIDADIAIDLVGARSTLVENNVISLNDPPSSIWCIGLNITDGGMSGGGGVEDQSASAVTARNNSVFIEGRPGAGACRGIRFAVSQGTGHRSYSNAVQLLGVPGASYCYEYQAPSLVAEDNNLCGLGGAGTYADIAGAGRTLAQARELLGGCPNAGNACASQESDPGFAAPGAPAYDLSLSSASIARDAGHAQLSSPIDVTGRARPVGTGFDSGAYEFDDSPPGATPVPPILLD